MTKFEKEKLYEVWGRQHAWYDELVDVGRYDEANSVAGQILTLNELVTAFGLQEEFDNRYNENRKNHRRF